MYLLFNKYNLILQFKFQDIPKLRYFGKIGLNHINKKNNPPF